MIKLSKGTIAGISGASAVIIAGTTVLVNVALTKEKGNTGTTNPLNRDSSYHICPLTNILNNNKEINNLIECVKTDKQITYIIDETKFVNGMQKIVRDALKTISFFKLNYLNYIIDCHYKINKTKSVLVDLVWYEPNSKTKFYDQFEMYLQAA